MTRVGVVQMEPRVGELDENLDRAASYLRAMAADGVTLAVLPELFGSGYDLGVDQRELAAATGEKIVHALGELSRELDMTLASAVLVETDDGALEDRAVVIAPDGVLATAGKRYLWGEENEHFAPGAGGGAVAPTQAGTVGVAICYEGGFPEAARDLATRGAEIIAIPSAFGRARLHAWELLTRSRALENGCYVLAAGITGTNPSGVEFAGHSRVVGPRGDVLASMALEEGWLAVDIEPEAVTAARAEIPYLHSLELDRERTRRRTTLTTEGTTR